ncbi:Pogo transposable element with KRAB domain [Frankliniella fusca]|uniref:Pogo transposable element with KRAB domain n=1 Tax=Frankliniella fusca TaxID=407009 RepID=A0AAE1HX08_9NEOP|nr:Pogo transposable element with KRAB domain [Frankliniella fusca]KAK3924791.1 Pogo transposable element with KRAB domain [Frankliniella fusca]KAK3929219.1 Pogo transposable element with KRAB domain [Frankliniella fusca]KAK3931394.1 Pogo transposable element with KRAB domain [Frankliniella fusca]
MARQRSSGAARPRAARPSTPVRIGAKPRGPRGRYFHTPSYPKRMEKAVLAVQRGMSVRQAAYVYNVRRSTLNDRTLKPSLRPTAGRPIVLSHTVEEAIVAHVSTQAEWGFPLCKLDLQLIVRDYLNAQQIVEKRFKDNTPGNAWLRCFFKRHPELRVSKPKLLSSSRAKVNPDQLKKYFQNLKESLEGVPPENIYNYDETNLADDPSQKTVEVRRDQKYPTKVLTSSKTATSLMIAGTATGELLPPYVVYRSKELSETWVTGGPPGTRYNRSRSGWFDRVIFTDWFRNILVPNARRKEGTKVVIGDNLSSHFSEEVFSLCREHNIRFVCLPANSTHILQPLDVAFFGPLKMSWRSILGQWKRSARHRSLTLPKPEFPGLLNKLMDSIKGRAECNLLSAFRATGINPLDPNEALKRVPGGLPSPTREEVFGRVSDTFVENLQELRYGTRAAVQRGRRLAVSPDKSWVQPGQGASANEVSSDDPDSPDTEEGGESEQASEPNVALEEKGRPVVVYIW